MEQKKTFKVVLIGDQYTGKTCIIKRFVENVFRSVYHETPISLFQTKDVHGCTLDIWDTAGSEDWQSMNSSVYHGSHAVIFLCSYDKQQSLDNIKNIWLQRVRQFMSDIRKVKFFLAVNKSDIPEDDKTIDESQIEQMKNDLNVVDLFIVSAKDNINVTELFEAVADTLINEYPIINPTPIEPQEAKSSCC